MRDPCPGGGDRKLRYEKEHCDHSACNPVVSGLCFFGGVPSVSNGKGNQLVRTDHGIPVDRADGKPDSGFAREAAPGEEGAAENRLEKDRKLSPACL